MNNHLVNLSLLGPCWLYPQVTRIIIIILIQLLIFPIMYTLFIRQDMFFVTSKMVQQNLCWKNKQTTLWSTCSFLGLCWLYPQMTRIIIILIQLLISPIMYTLIISQGMFIFSLPKWWCKNTFAGKMNKQPFGQPSY